MAKKRKKKCRACAVASRSASPRLEAARDYLVYWRNGLKSRCNGFRLSQALGFYLARARLILDAQTRENIYTGD